MNSLEDFKLMLRRATNLTEDYLSALENLGSSAHHEKSLADVERALIRFIVTRGGTTVNREALLRIKAYFDVPDEAPLLTLELLTDYLLEQKVVRVRRQPNFTDDRIELGISKASLVAVMLHKIERSGLNQKDYCERWGIPRSTLSAAITGRRNIPVALAEMLGYEPVTLYRKIGQGVGSQPEVGTALVDLVKSPKESTHADETTDDKANK
jgi:hypothetical protein